MILFERETLSELMVGSTHYVDVGERREVSVYYPSETEVYMKTQDAKIMTGQLALRDVGYHVRWRNGPCDKFNIAEHMGAFVYINADGQSAGTITKIVHGNPEHF